MATATTPLSLLISLESANAGSADLDEEVRTLFSSNHQRDVSRLNPTTNMDDAVAMVPDTCWWVVERRKNMPGLDFPNPANGLKLYLAKVGLHIRQPRTGKKGLKGAANTAELALCAALINALYIASNP